MIAKWGWYNTLDFLANRKPWKHNFILEMKVMAMHHLLAYKLELRINKAKLRSKK